MFCFDVDAVSDDVEAALAEINRCADWLVTVIAAKQQQAQDLMRFWSERRIHRLLIKPAAAGITRLLLESAFARFIELRELHENTDSMEIPHELIEAENAKQRRWLWPAIGFALAIVIAAALWLSGVFTPVEDSAPAARIAVTQPVAADRPAAPEPDAAQTPVLPVAAADLVPEVAVLETADAPPAAERLADPYADQIAFAQAAEIAGNFVTPPGNNALDYYAAILSEAPEHPVALARLDALLEEQFAQAQLQILQSDFDAAQATLDHIDRGNPTGTRLEFLRQQLRQLRESATQLEQARLAVIESPPAAADTVIPELSGEPTELQSMLTLTRLRLSQGLLAEPAGDSARDYLLRALDLGVTPTEIQDLAEQFSAAAFGRIPQALAEEDFVAAGALLSTTRQLGLSAPESALWEAQIEAARLAASTEEHAALHAAALQRIGTGAYTGSDDSAVALLNQLREYAADAALITDLEARLTNAISNSTREAIAAGRWNEADELLGVFSKAGLEPAVFQSLSRDLDIARRQQGYLAETVPMGELTLLESVPAAYPRLALTNGVTGWVDLHFTVNMNGETQDIEVVESQPPGQFENAAIAALERYRFDPFERDGRIYERRARLRMRFELD